MSSAKDHDTSRSAAAVRNRLAEVRQKRGVAAAELARRAGVSRQTIYAMEAGDYVPNTAVALKLARLLEVAVEELFLLEGDEPAPRRTVEAELIGAGDRFAGSPIEVCRVNGRLVGVPALTAPWQMVPADGLLVDARRSTVQLFEEEPEETRLLIAGCDPATSVLARHLARGSVRLVTAAVNSSVALDLLKRRMVHVAGTHLKDEGTALRTQFPRKGVSVVTFAVWEEGLVLARGNPKGIHGVADLAEARVRIAPREPGSGSRQLLDRELGAAHIPARSVRGYDDAPAAGHLPAAWRVHTGMADCCVATRSAARAFGLDFIPLASERYDLVIRSEHLNTTAVERLLDTLAQAAFRRELEALCGYDTRETGKRQL
ncbi:MAG TPA: substrate-binding domain-containing protein [Bryobacteraceae bacterium]|nr:substrate-binding domain-containing protein [Bryobacteraceae bacterium]